MPFKIIRNDITKVHADAIVNTANPKPCYASGTDAAVYRAAGAKQLLAERRKIGTIAPGEAAVTAAFRLPAKYIIHTVGPVWVDGHHGEFDTLRSCYRKSLLLADQLGCESIAFPLIATGVYGFPKDKALYTALSVIREHLEESDLDVILVVFGLESYQTAAGVTEQIEEYIDEKYVAEQTEAEYGRAPSGLPGMWRQERWGRETYSESMKPGSAVFGSMAPPPMMVPDEEAALSEAAPLSAEAELFDEEDDEYLEETELFSSVHENSPVFHGPERRKASLEEMIAHLGESFQQRLLRMIDERGMTDPEVYKRANVDRKLFSKIRCSEDYTPKKKTIVALAIALRLNLDDTKDLLASAGLALTNNSKADLIVSFCIENGIYDIFEVNALLFKFGQPILG